MNDLAQRSIRTHQVRFLAMIVSLRHLLGWMVSGFRSREDRVLENLALRQQLLALQHRFVLERSAPCLKAWWRMHIHGALL